jgi:hypothetical protein
LILLIDLFADGDGRGNHRVAGARTGVHLRLAG